MVVAVLLLLLLLVAAAVEAAATTQILKKERFLVGETRDNGRHGAPKHTSQCFPKSRTESQQTFKHSHEVTSSQKENWPPHVPFLF